MAIFPVLYAGGYLTQLIENYSIWQKAGHILGDGTAPSLSQKGVSVCLSAAFSLMGLKVLFFLGLAISVIVLFAVFIGKGEKGDYDTERKFHYSEKGSYGTARFMDKRRMKELLDVTGIQKTEGTILGTIDGAVVSIPVASRMNRNIAVFGASGSMKSRAFVRNMIFQSVKRGESLILTDPKSELYEDMSVYLKEQGYIVRVFNLVQPEHSDRWNCINEVSHDQMMAPNWLNDGNTLLYNADGKIYRYEIDKDHVEQVDTGFCVQCNNDHVPSPDNQLLAVSCMPPELTDGTYESHIYVLPMTGGEPKDLTGPGLSYLHGWSPDGKELAYCAFRKKPEEETMRIEICTIPSDGGEETCLTDGKGYNDGPEYSPDGKHIWFNSTRSGLMQVWRMNRDGSGLTQMTDFDANNWFGHVSPDGKHVIYLTFAKGELEPNEHLPNMYVSLGMMDYDGQNKKKVLDLFGGQGSINVNSWAPDSRRIAYVKYVLHHK